MPGTRDTASGFTIVELVTVMILLGILSVAAVSRMVSPSDFAPGMVSSSTAAQLRFARGLAMSREDTSVTFELSVSGADWLLNTRSVADGTVREETVERGNTTVDITNGVITETVTTGASLALQFDSSGNLSGANAGATVLNPMLGISVVISGKSNRRLCLYATGYVSEGDCV